MSNQLASLKINSRRPSTNLLASGGIPVGGLTEGGKIVTARIEHVWVEVLIDYIPSRGSRHKTGRGDTWIPLDASFKQHTYTPGMDIKAAVPFDAQSSIEQIKASATINETEGYVTNVSSTLTQQVMQDYQTRIQNYISQNYPNATVGDVLGKKEIIKYEFPILLGTLPYNDIATGAKYSSLPDSLRHKVTFSVTSDNIYFDPQPLSSTKSLAEIAGKKITLSYSPATQADENVINSYLPKPHVDGTPIQPNELPSSVPAYLINLKPELRIDGVLIATGGAIGMGQEEALSIDIAAPTTAKHSISNRVIAGEFNAIAFDISRISPEQMTVLKTKLETTKAKLEAQEFSNLTKEDILGDILYTTVLSYFAELDAMDYISAQTIGVFATRLPSTGRFFNTLAVAYIFGTPVSVSSGGLSMDIGLIRTLVRPPDGTKDKQLQFMLTSGSKSSALEHSVPEQVFSTPTSPVQGISAVKALRLANDQGIPIYMINQSNISAVLPQLQLGLDVLADIQNAVNAGKVVTVSKSNITLDGWTGCGYIVIDSTKGDGAYMISGGLAGGWLNWVMIGVGTGLLAVAGVLAYATITTVIAEGLFAAIIGILLTASFLFNALTVLYGLDKTGKLYGCLITSFAGIADIFQEIFEKGIDYFLTLDGATLATKTTFKTIFKAVNIVDIIDDTHQCFSEFFGVTVLLNFQVYYCSGKINEIRHI
jgi:hypothetical protein